MKHKIIILPIVFVSFCYIGFFIIIGGPFAYHPSVLLVPAGSNSGVPYVSIPERGWDSESYLRSIEGDVENVCIKAFLRIPDHNFENGFWESFYSHCKGMHSEKLVNHYLDKNDGLMIHH